MEKIDKILKKKKLLLQVLEEVQAQYACLPENVLKYISKKLEIPMSKIYGTASFYHLFNVQKCGTNVIRVCNSPSCHVNGSLNILEFLKKNLKVNVGQTTKNNQYTLELSPCLGCCDKSPAIMLNNKVHFNITEEKLKKLLKIKK